MTQPELNVLNFLFNSSRKDSNQSYDIKPIAGKDALMIANKLLRSGLIRDDIQNDVTFVRCSISIDGIRAVDPAFVDNKIKDVLSSAGEAGTIWNVMDLLKEKQEAFQLCFDLANYMQNNDLVKLLYAQYPAKVMVEVTLIGQRYNSPGGR
jgi:hypothetical protein